MPRDAHKKDAQSFIESLDNEPELQLAILGAAARLGDVAEVTKRENRIRLSLSLEDAEFLCSLIGGLIIDEIEARKRAQKIYKAMLKAGMRDDF